MILASICGTDLHFVDDPQLFAHMPRKPYPFGLGHEFVGRLDEMDAGFPRKDAYGSPLQAGDRVVFYSSETACGECYMCRTLMSPHLCMRRDMSSLGGAFADYVTIPPGSTVFKVPDSLPTEIAVLAEPLCGSLRSLERALSPGVPDRAQGFGPGKIAVVQGSGAMGILIAILLKMCGAYRVIMIGAPDFRLRLAERFGVDMTIDIRTTPDPAERLRMAREMTPHGVGADVVFEAAGVPSAFVEALELARAGGTVVELAHWTLRGTVDFSPVPICAKDLQVLGVVGYPPQQFGSALRILDDCQGRVRFPDLITHRVQIEGIADGLRIMRSQQCMKVLVTMD